MANRIVLNPVSYHGKGAVENIVPELTARGCKKAFICSDPDLLKFGVVGKVTALLDAAEFPYVIFVDVKLNLQETDYGNFLSEEVCFECGVGDVL